MATRWQDEDTKVIHIRVHEAMTLCGIMQGWTRLGDQPVKMKWSTNCLDCQEELEDLRSIKK